jgi:hypothetical protein
MLDHRVAYPARASVTAKTPCRGARRIALILLWLA